MKQYLVILKKEFLTIVRDVRTFVAIFIPIFLIPAVYWGIGALLNDINSDVAEVIPVYCNVQDDKEKLDIIKELLPDINVEFIETDNPEDSLKKEEVYVIINVKDCQVDALPISIELVYNANSNLSTVAYSEVGTALQSANIALTCMQLELYGVDTDVIDNIRLDVRSISDNAILVMLAPLLITGLLVSGGSSIAADTFAGEKERGTMEQVAVTQVKRSALLNGKLTMVLIATIVSAAISVVAYLISIKISPDLLKAMGLEGSSDLSLSPKNIGYLVAVILSFAMCVSSALTLISLLSKTAKSAQAIMGLITFLPSILSMLVMFISTSSINKWMMAIPIFGEIMSLKLIFADAMELELFVINVVSQIAYAAVCYGISCIAIRQNKHLI